MSTDIDAAAESIATPAPPVAPQTTDIRKFRLETRHYVYLALIASAAVIPAVLGIWLERDFIYFTAQVAFVFAMLGLSVTVVTGYAGLISLMPYSFAGLGALFAALAMSSWGWPFWLVVPVAALVTIPISFVVGVISVRLKGLYLAIATLTFSNALGETLFRWDPLIGGRTGWIITRPTLFGIDFAIDLPFYLLCLLSTVALVVLLEGLRKSRMGRAMLAVRDNELEAQALGINVYKTKLVAFIISGMVAGVAGAYLATLRIQVSGESFRSPFVELNSFLLVTAVVIGGMDRAWGAFVGALVLTINTQIAQGAEKAFAFLGIYTAVGLIIFLLFRPGGLIQVFQTQRQLIKRKPVLGIALLLVGLGFNVAVITLFLTVLK